MYLHINNEQSRSTLYTTETTDTFVQLYKIIVKNLAVYNAF